MDISSNPLPAPGVQDKQSLISSSHEDNKNQPGVIFVMWITTTT